jgi:hypothetical protein
MTDYLYYTNLYNYIIASLLQHPGFMQMLLSVLLLIFSFINLYLFNYIYNIYINIICKNIMADKDVLMMKTKEMNPCSFSDVAIMMRYFHKIFCIVLLYSTLYSYSTDVYVYTQTA